MSSTLADGFFLGQVLTVQSTFHKTLLFLMYLIACFTQNLILPFFISVACSKKVESNTFELSTFAVFDCRIPSLSYKKCVLFPSAFVFFILE